MECPKLESKRIYLVPLSLYHLSEKYVEWMNDNEVNKYLESGGDYTMQKLYEFLAEVEKKKILFWAIHLKSDDKHIGNIKIDPINFKHGFAEYGILLGDKLEWGKGFAKEASNLVIDYCFKELKLRRITLGVIKNNLNAIKLYQSLGFKIEGTYIKHLRHMTEYFDVIRMAIFDVNYI